MEQLKSGSRVSSEYLYLDEMLTQGLLKLDSINASDQDSIKAFRKDSIKCISQFGLEGKARRRRLCSYQLVPLDSSSRHGAVEAPVVCYVDAILLPAFGTFKFQI